jgi:hypothetical protein
MYFQSGFSSPVVHEYLLNHIFGSRKLNNVLVLKTFTFFRYPDNQNSTSKAFILPYNYVINFSLPGSLTFN